MYLVIDIVTCQSIKTTRVNNSVPFNQPIDDQYMRKLVSRTVKESAADFWYEIRVARPNITWEEIQDVF